MSLYKYVTPARLDVLRNLRIRFTQPTAQNDPFEFRPLVRGFGDPTIATKLLSEQYDRQVPEELKKYAAPLNLSVPDFVDRLKPSLVALSAQLFERMSPFLVESVFETLGKTLGILSLSETPRSLPMWAHYSTNHSGFVFEFDDRHPWFWTKKADTDEIRHLRRVTYAEALPSRYLGDLAGQDLFYTKLKEWEYEQEWRIIRPLAEASQRLGADVYLFDIPPESIRGVIKGIKTTATASAELESILRGDPNLGHVQTSQARLSSETNTIEIQISP